MTSFDENELFSLTYIQAVAVNAGYQLADWQVDDQSVDGSLRPLGRRSPIVHFQAKSTTQDFVKTDGIHFPLDKDNFNDLRDPDEAWPFVLIVVLLPEVKDEWLSQSTTELCLRRCGYFLSLRGEPRTENKVSRTVVIPLDNVFNKENLDALMKSARPEYL